MTEKYEMYRGGAKRVRKGWSRDWHNYGLDGELRVCLIQSIADEGRISRWLPDEMVDEITGVLKQYPTFRLAQLICAIRADDDRYQRQRPIMAWNDIFGSQKRVAAVLEQLADKTELEFLRVENARLKATVTRLEHSIKELEESKAILTARVAAMRSSRGSRVRNTINLLRDEQELSEVSRDLDRLWRKLTDTEVDLESERFTKIK